MARRKTDNRPFWTGDCETDPFKFQRVPKPFIWGLYTGAGYHEFETADQFADFIRDCDAVVYFHNGGRFDFHFMLEHINLHEDMKVINGRLVSAHIGKCEIRDSYNILTVPLSAYKKDDFDYTLMEAAVRAKHMPQIRQYLKNDCVFLHELISAFERENGRHLTLAGAAMKRWETIAGRKAPRSDRAFFQQFSPWYSGGRVECFQKGRIEGPVKVYDIRSAYMWAMRHKHPFGTVYTQTEGVQDFQPTSFLTVECVSNGALPWRNEYGALSFPCDGELRQYSVVGHELEAALETGAVSRLRILSAIDFAEHIDFDEYVTMCYTRRLQAQSEGDIATDLIEKLFGNGLYGKWAANPDNYGNFVCVPFDTMEDYLCPHATPEECDEYNFAYHRGLEDTRCDGYKFDGLIGPHALLRAPLDEWQCHFLNIATAASITSMVRAKLWRALSAAHEPMYCDTDSMFCRAPGDNLALGKTLGDWKFEGTADTLWIAGKKLYLCDGLIEPKTGKPKMATKGSKLTPQQVRNIVLGGVEMYEPEAPTFSLHRKPEFVSRKIRATA